MARMAKRMSREMKDSGIEWIGEIPIDWEIIKVKSRYKMVTGFTPDTDESLYYDDENGYTWINISDLSSEREIFDSKNKITKLATEKCKVAYYSALNYQLDKLRLQELIYIQMRLLHLF